MTNEESTEEIVDIRVRVPASRETDFYRWFADWKDGLPVYGSAAATGAAAGMAAGVRATSPQLTDDLDAAIKWWKSQGPRQRALFGMWIDATPNLVSADAIMAHVGLKSAREIPGLLSWVKRNGEKVGFRVDWDFRTDPTTEAPLYGIEDRAYSQILRDARTAVQGA